MTIQVKHCDTQKYSHIFSQKVTAGEFLDFYCERFLRFGIISLRKSKRFSITDFEEINFHKKMFDRGLFAKQSNKTKTC
eukprot:TRINITY_DN6759_c0_g1_i1.p1 TRINITY_DN6759_c0_g1~~TRINITY_DN6759_c0_g1_i1.p1  ORF type:complete len:79 (+),score=9.39 TRINITY_DN6759_c0_g1_i1:63-299(+)